MKLYEKCLCVFGIHSRHAQKFDRSALETEMMRLRARMTELEDENRKLRNLVAEYAAEHNARLSSIAAKSKAALERIGHKW